MSEYSTKEETNSVIVTPSKNDVWLNNELERINPNRNEMGNSGDVDALIKLIYELKSKLDSFEK